MYQPRFRWWLSPGEKEDGALSDQAGLIGGHTRRTPHRQHRAGEEYEAAEKKKKKKKGEEGEMAANVTRAVARAEKRAGREAVDAVKM